MHNPRMRRRARERALQFLFGLDFTRYAWDQEIDAYWEASPARPSVRQYADVLIRGVSEHIEDLDTRIRGALDKWTPDRVGRVEWVVMRIALFEMMHQPDVPASVAIDEAIEVAKRFGAEDAPRFINGVLDRLRRKLEQETSQAD